MIYAEPRLLPFGDRALLVEFGDEIGDRVHARVAALDADLVVQPIPGLVETVPSYAALLVEYDPLRLPYARCGTVY